MRPHSTKQLPLLQRSSDGSSCVDLYFAAVEGGILMIGRQLTRQKEVCRCYQGDTYECGTSVNRRVGPKI
jgi:hypothetical protein